MQGNKNDQGKPPISMLTQNFVVEVAKVMEFGAKKYARDNWRNGIAWSRIIDSAYRHLGAFNAGEDNDPETGLSHIAHLACNCMFLLEYIHTHSELDDRYRSQEIVESKLPKEVCPGSYIQELNKLAAVDWKPEGKKGL